MASETAPDPQSQVWDTASSGQGGGVIAGRSELVTKVLDGDTFLTASRKDPIRLANVDAPERRTPGSPAATDQLRRLIEGEKVRIVTQARDSYGRSVANVYAGNGSVNNQMRQRLK